MAYVLGITRVDPIRHELLFERFINEGRTAYPDVDIDFSSERREEVIQYVYEHYGAEHTGMVCNLVTYRARSAVREVGYALGFPRPLVDRVAKALETYDSVMVRRDLEAEGGFARFFARPGEDGGSDAVGGRGGSSRRCVAGAAAMAGERGLTDPMGQLNHGRGGRFGGTSPRSTAMGGWCGRGGAAARGRTGGGRPAGAEPPVRSGGSGATRRIAGCGTRSGGSRRGPTPPAVAMGPATRGARAIRSADSASDSRIRLQGESGSDARDVEPATRRGLGGGAGVATSGR